MSRRCNHVCVYGAAYLCLYLVLVFHTLLLGNARRELIAQVLVLVVRGGQLAARVHRARFERVQLRLQLAHLQLEPLVDLFQKVLLIEEFVKARLAKRIHIFSCYLYESN